MKKIYMISMLLIGATIFYACSDDEDNVLTNPTSQIPDMSANINGTDWSADLFAGLDSGGLVIIAGTKSSDNSSITMAFENGVAEQSYNLGDTTSEVLVTYNASLTEFGIASSGTVNISNFNSTLLLVSGTFNFETDSTFLTPTPFSVTNGEFTNVKIIKK